MINGTGPQGQLHSTPSSNEGGSFGFRPSFVHCRWLPSAITNTGRMERMQLTFDCPARWEDMTPCEGGRFCHGCSKPVLDFTTRSREELVRHMKMHPATCGRHLPEQLDPSLVPVDALLANARRGLFAALAALAMHGAFAQQRIAPEALREQPSVAIPESLVDNPVPQKAGPGMVQVKGGHPVCPVPDNKGKRWYISSRYPFVHRRRVRTVGCPTF